MYHISIYFDDKSDSIIRNYYRTVEASTDNTYLQDNNVPPHITLAVFNTTNEVAAIEAFFKVKSEFDEGSITWVSVGGLGNSVLCIVPVYNEYLHNLNEMVHKYISDISDIQNDNRYNAFNWFPHATIGKTLTPEQQGRGFCAMQKQFGKFESRAVRIGLAKTNPYREIQP